MIRLTDGYAIDVDSHCYTVGIPKKSTTTNSKTGEIKESTCMTEAKYFSTLDKALEGWWRVMRKKELSKFDGTINEALEVVKKLDEKVLNTISVIKAETVQN
jgi:hypothetical protein